MYAVHILITAQYKLNKLLRHRSLHYNFGAHVFILGPTSPAVESTLLQSVVAVPCDIYLLLCTSGLCYSQLCHAWLFWQEANNMTSKYNEIKHYQT